ncbi:MAG: acetate kinase [Candidatus Nomurabacteria bacterium]|jgi:acetate kinase|nr:acetate kinase [Candidatus Nomurabacteria bacterium]
MKNILVINSGSSSLKFQVIDIDTEQMLLKGLAEPLGDHKATVSFKYNGKETEVTIPAPATHTDALKAIFHFLDEQDLTKTITSVGHRVVHGGEKINSSVKITSEVIAIIKDAIPYAPLHNPAALLGIEAVSKIAPNMSQVAVFDTAFHSTMPDYAYRYAVPTSWYTKHGVRRYGAHGTSYRFIVEKLSHILNKPTNKINAIIAHLGSGASIAAIKNGQSVDTTMGFTPLEGLSMATRSGDVDASIVPFIMTRENLTADQVIMLLNKESGHKGVSGFSDDTRELEAEAAKGHKDAQLSLNIFSHRAAKLIAGLMTSLDSLDALVFTAGVGENRFLIRADIVAKLGIFGFKIDDQSNNTLQGRNGDEGLISSSDSKYPIYELITNEELMIARDTNAIAK